MTAASGSDILVVDDVGENARLLTIMLAADGYEVRTAASGMEALALVQQKLPDLILLDVMLPEMDGYAVARQLKGSTVTRHIPIILVTSLSDHGSRVKGLEAGAEEFLSKPVERAELSVRVRNLLRLKELHDLLGDRNKLLVHQVRERTAELESSYRETLYLLTRAAEYRDKDTGSHIYRISDYCSTLAGLIGLDPEFQQRIHYSSPMHDIGKIAIPDHILLKKGKLDAGEWEVMKTHASIGGKLLADGNSEYLRMGAEIAQFHHERWDGSGYPGGLAEFDIPLPARIMSICDTYDALRSERPYKPAYSHQHAIEIMSIGDGRTRPEHYDPDILDHFLRNDGAFEEIYAAFDGHLGTVGGGHS
jgi:putative two-component system response regulator